MNEEDLRKLLKSGALESHMFSAIYGKVPVNKHIIQERVKEKYMKPLTQSELEVLKEAENILFLHLDDELEDIFSNSAIALHIAIKNYTKALIEETMLKHKKSMENYVKKWYNKKSRW